MKKILFLQNEILNYRKPLYNCLSEFYEVTIFHSGIPSKDENDLYTEIIKPQKKILGIYVLNILDVNILCKRYDIIVAMFDLRWPAYILPAILYNHKLILWGHRYSGNYIANYIRDFLINRVKINLLYGDEEITKMVKRNVRLNNLKIAWNTIFIPNHEDTSNFPKTSILFVGRLQPSKNIDKILELFSELINITKLDIKLEIVGSDAKEFPGTLVQLQKIVENLEISSNVSFHGNVNDHFLLKKIFSRSYAYLSPSPLGLGILHSFSYGVPVITLANQYHGPEYSNIINCYNSIVCNSLSEIQNVLIKTLDSKLLSLLGHNAYLTYINERSFNRMLNGFHESFNEK